MRWGKPFHFGHGGGQQKDGSSVEEGVGDIVDSFYDLWSSPLAEHDGGKEDQGKQRHGEADDGCTKTCAFVDEKCDSSDEEDGSHEVSPEETEWDVLWHEFGQRDSGREFGMQEVFESKEDQSDGDDRTGDVDQDF